MDAPLEILGQEFDASVFVDGGRRGFVHGYEGVPLLFVEGGVCMDGVLQVAAHFNLTVQVAMRAERITTGHQFVVVGQLERFQQAVVHVLLHALVETYQPIGLIGKDTCQRKNNQKGNGAKRNFHRCSFFVFHEDKEISDSLCLLITLNKTL